MQIPSSSGKYKTNIYHNACYLQLFRRDKVFNPFFLNKRLLFLQDIPWNKRHPLKL